MASQPIPVTDHAPGAGLGAPTQPAPAGKLWPRTKYLLALGAGVAAVHFGVQLVGQMKGIPAGGGDQAREGARETEAVTRAVEAEPTAPATAAPTEKPAVKPTAAPNLHIGTLTKESLTHLTRRHPASVQRVKAAFDAAADQFGAPPVTADDVVRAGAAYGVNPLVLLSFVREGSMYGSKPGASLTGIAGEHASAKAALEATAALLREHYIGIASAKPEGGDEHFSMASVVRSARFASDFPGTDAEAVLAAYTKLRTAEPAGRDDPDNIAWTTPATEQMLMRAQAAPFNMQLMSDVGTRKIVRDGSWSHHAFGTAVDVTSTHDRSAPGKDPEMRQFADQLVAEAKAKPEAAPVKVIYGGEFASAETGWEWKPYVWWKGDREAAVADMGAEMAFKLDHHDHVHVTL